MNATDARTESKTAAQASSSLVTLTYETCQNKITQAIDAAIRSSRFYADMRFSSIDNGKYNDTLINWTSIVPSLSVEQHKKGPSASTWNTKVMKELLDDGYDFVFTYAVDAEYPSGIRISWWDDTCEGTDPLIQSWDDNGYHILPINRYVLPNSDKIATNVVAPAIIASNVELIDSVFQSIGAKIATAANEGNNIITIPWSSLGDFEQIQSLFVQYKTSYNEVENPSYSDIFNKFNYGNVSSGQYSSPTYRSFTRDEFYPVDMGFFANKTWTEKDYTSFNTAPFTLIKILRDILGYTVLFYSLTDQNTGKRYCDGLAIGWKTKADGPDPNVSNFVFNNDVASENEYNNNQTTLYQWENGQTPTFSSYKTAKKSYNANNLNALINLTISKMNQAFEKDQRAIAILWTDINSKYPDTVKDSWENDNNLYAGTFKTSLGEYNEGGGKARLSNVFNILVNGTSFNVGYNTNCDYTWSLIRYKNNEELPSTAADMTYEISLADSCGIVVALNGDDESGTAQKIQVASAIKAVQEEYANKNAPKG